MIFWRLVLLGVWGLGGLSALVVLLSMISSTGRMIERMSMETVEVAAEHSGSCGAYGDCDDFQVDRSDLASLQRGAAFYANYCSGCHSLSYSRHLRVQTDLNIPEEVYERNLLPSDRRIGDHIVSAMSEADGALWFGASPPDLTMVTDVRSPDWIYTYLRSFYVDETRPWGVNNLVFSQVSMPHVLANLQGEQRLGCVPVPIIAENGGEKRDPITGEMIYGEECGRLVHTAQSGSLSLEAYDEMVGDLVNYLAYTATPEQPLRHKIGAYTLVFLLILAVFSYLLYREYRKDYKP